MINSFKHIKERKSFMKVIPTLILMSTVSISTFQLNRLIAAPAPQVEDNVPQVSEGDCDSETYFAGKWDSFRDGWRGIGRCSRIDGLRDSAMRIITNLTKKFKNNECLRCIIQACYNGGEPGYSIGDPSDRIIACLAYFETLQGSWPIGVGGGLPYGDLISVVLGNCRDKCK